MAKTITSPVDEYPGQIIVHKPLSLPMVALLDETIEQAAGLKGSKGEIALLPALLSCVVEVKIAGIPEHPGVDDWPGSPRNAARLLLRWLASEVMSIYAGEKEIPNA